MEAGNQGKRISEAAAALPAAVLDCLLFSCPVVLRQEPRETGLIPVPLSADVVVHSPETATGSTRQNKLKRWRKTGWQASWPPTSIQVHTKQGIVGLGARVCPDISMPDQEIKGSEPTTQMRSGLPAGRRRPQPLPQSPKAGKFGVKAQNKVDSIKWIFPDWPPC